MSADCENCGGTGIARYQNKHKEWLEQPCHMCELEQRIESAGVYRDATYSARTQDQLRELERWLGDAPCGQDYVLALRDVVDRWDANEATETTFPVRPA